MMTMMFGADLTSTLAPFGWAAAAFVVLGLGAMIAALVADEAHQAAVPRRPETPEPEIHVFRPAA